MQRRGFLSAILALGCAPAVVKAESLMRVRPLASGLMVAEYDCASLAEIQGVQSIQNVWTELSALQFMISIDPKDLTQALSERRLPYIKWKPEGNRILVRSV